MSQIRMATELSVRCTTVYILWLFNLTVADIQTYSFVFEHMFTVTMLTNNCSMFAVCEMNLQILTNYFHVTIHVAAVQNCNRTFCSVFLREQDNMTLVTIWYIKYFSVFRIKQRIYWNISVGDQAFMSIVLSI